MIFCCCCCWMIFEWAFKSKLETKWPFNAVETHLKLTVVHPLIHSVWFFFLMVFWSGYFQSVEEFLAEISRRSTRRKRHFTVLFLLALKRRKDERTRRRSTTTPVSRGHSPIVSDRNQSQFSNNSHNFPSTRHSIRCESFRTWLKLRMQKKKKKYRQSFKLHWSANCSWRVKSRNYTLTHGYLTN